MTSQSEVNVLEFSNLCTLKNGILVSPTLYSINKTGKYLLWTIFVGIANTEDENKLKKVNVMLEHYEDRRELQDHRAGVYCTESGQEGGKITVSAKTVVFDGKNAGKANYTTPFTQAISDARSIYKNKIKKGYVEDKSILKPVDYIYTFEELAKVSERGNNSWRVFAMALHNYKKFSHKISFPATIQDKRDGTLFIAVHHPILPDKLLVDGNTKLKCKIDGYSRKRDTLDGQDHVLIELYPIASKYPGLHFVGELWKEGYNLQDISGAARRKADSKLKSERIKSYFNIFDCFY